MFANFEVCKAGLVAAAPKPRFARSASGCLQCRRKKKKCDERLPICGLCVKHHERCDQNTSRPRLSVSRSDLPLDIPPSVSTGLVESRLSVSSSPEPAKQAGSPKHANVLPFQLTKGRMRSLAMDAFQLPGEQRAVRFLLENFEALTSPSYISTKFSILPHAIPIALASPAIKNALMACSFSLLAKTSSLGTEDSIQARAYQCKALKGLAGNLLEGSAEENLSTILLLHIFEKISCDSLPTKRMHLLGATKLLGPALVAYKNTYAPPQINKFLIEAHVYHIALSSTFSGIAMAPLPRHHISNFLSILERMSGHMDRRDQWKTSSLLGVSHMIFDVIFRSSLLRRNLPLTASDRQYAEELKCSLSEWRWPPRDDHFSGNATPQPPEAMIRTGHLHRLACLLLLEKILNTSLQSENSTIRNIVTQFCQILIQMQPEQVEMSIHLWPFLIVGSAAQTSAEKDLFMTPFVPISGTIRCGDRLQCQNFLIDSWAFDESNHSSLGIDILLRDDIMSSVFI